MLAKYWKRILLIIVIILCLLNIIIKLTKVISFDTTINNLKAKFSTSQSKEEKK